MTPGFDLAGFNAGTYAGSLEATLHTMRRKWPAARIVHGAVHKLGSRGWGTQLVLRTATLQICAKWGVAVADAFADTAFDTRVDAQRATYSFNGLVGGHPDTGTHPNISGITKFYAPVLTAELARVARETPRRTALSLPMVDHFASRFNLRCRWSPPAG